MSDHHREKDAVTGVETTGHEWDGIRELDNPLPRWWLWVFWACVLFSIGYWVAMPAWPGLTGHTEGLLGKSDRRAVASALADLKAQRGANALKLRDATLAQIESDPALQAYALSVGQSVFGDNCATCHGPGGAGAKGYPNLRDDVWLWGGSLEDISTTLKHGIRSGDPQARISQMPAFGRDGLLDERQVSDLTDYVLTLSGRPADRAAAGRAGQLFVDQCSSCHGPAGKGSPAVGAPDLTDGEWLYGSDRQSIHDQIYYGRNGVMPAWGQRFDAETIKAIAVYIHANSGQ